MHDHDPKDIGEKKKRVKKSPQPFVRETGKSLFPVSRVQKIIKADKDIPIIAKEATFLISLATEEFIKRLCEAAHKSAERNSRQTVQHKDLATIVRKADEFLFLEDIIPWAVADGPVVKRKPKQPGADSSGDAGLTLLDQFVTKKAAPVIEDEPDEDITMNDDGTMTVG
ncbi:histone-fold-containing protein [Guyanagaster necrorhizus]|uniref:Histone-fold-containing protein n=1 Tax=Guyanagaster necrorhizus TaxID=856835 RepID=A0A9P7VSB1_9AGAR|nr:histone-fold-containing protein [Guyanagaster necrorhizus MCA 3950]KAG7445795.1 histone-fold-containing protein [Guyanagaster necrorhizus MCA 3950]